MTALPDPEYQGRGEIRRGGQLLAKVQYNLYEDQVSISVEELGTRRPRKQFEKRVRGTIVVFESEGYEDLAKYRSGPVALYRADNSSVPIVILSRTKRNPPTYEVEVSE